ncbi:uncharacterized protein LOC133196909 [Saccostrea echinata]|uniref:uncharacterized protein LOC133196909 n=1 Tax=Saccostrea echinata TaxID=191078 RepID=UPI002A806A13|nr:uncharacterized protein LOC133196909 [Saccostrea echinata]
MAIELVFHPYSTYTGVMDRCLFLQSLIFSFVTAGNRRYFVTDFCGKVIGPDFGAYLEFDRNSDIEWKTNNITVPDRVKGTEFNCIILLQGMPSTGEKRHMSLSFRYFTLKEKTLETIENTVANCGKAYLTIYNGKDVKAPEKYTLCGGSAFPSFYQFEGTEFITLKFYIDFRKNITVQENIQSQTEVNQTTIARDPYPYPDVFFRLDVTSFTYDCNDSVPGVVMLCNESRRCLDDSLRCDNWLSRNCRSSLHPRDDSDVAINPPGNCFKGTTTLPTTPVQTPRPDPPDLRPIYFSFGIIILAIASIWCCWRPGYLPWRCARFRNIPFCRTCLACQNKRCLRCYSVCLSGPSPWLQKHRKISSTNSIAESCDNDASGIISMTAVTDRRPVSNKVFPIQQFDGSVVIPALGEARVTETSRTKTNIEVEWIKLLSYDGNHLRGHR